MSILQLLPSVHAPLTTEALSRGIADASACFSPSISNPLRQHVQISPADRNSPFFAPAITPHWALGRGRKPQSGLLCVARSSHMPQILFYHHAVPERRLTQRFRLLIKAAPPTAVVPSFFPSFSYPVADSSISFQLTNHPELETAFPLHFLSARIGFIRRCPCRLDSQ